MADGLVPGRAAPQQERRGARTGPRGRVAEDAARDAVRAAIGALPLRRDLLIEHLHALQDRHGCLRAGHLVALAELLRLAPVEVFEVASFYHHFDVLEDAAPAPPAVTIRVCESLPCAMAGAHRLLEALRAAPPDGARILAAPCMGACHRAPAAALGHELVEHATPERLAAALRGGPPALPVPPGLAAYQARGGYAALRRAQEEGAAGHERRLAVLEAAT